MKSPKPSRQLEQQLRRVARELDDATVSPDRLDPIVLQQRKVVPAMKDLNDLNDIIDNEPHDAYDAGSVKRRGAGAARVISGGLVGALAMGGFVLARGGSLSPSANDKQNVTTSVSAKPYMLMPASAPEGLCLQYVQSFQDIEEQRGSFEAPQVTQLKRGDSGISINMMFNGGGLLSDALVGETADVNGRKALLTGGAENRMLTWKQGQTGVQMLSTKVGKEELLKIARSIVFAFDENGARIASITAPGFESSNLDPRDQMGFASLGYGECDQKDFTQPGKNIGVSTGPSSQLELMNLYSSPNVETKETKVSLARGEKSVDAKLISMTFPGMDEPQQSLVWTERDAAVTVNFNKVSKDEALAFARSLKEATAQDYDALRDTVKTPNYPQPEIPGQPKQNEQTEIGSLTFGRSKMKVLSATSGDKLCLYLQSPSLGGGGNCQKPAKEPAFQLTSSNGKYSVAVAIVDASITKATVSLPGGKTTDVPSFQDDRLRSVRAFVWVRSQDDPVATNISFVDSSGKVVNEQKSNDEPGSPNIASATVAVAVGG